MNNHGFRIAFGNIQEAGISGQVTTHHAHNATRAFLVALNVATIGMFYWASDPWVHPIYEICEEPDTPPIRQSALVVQPNSTFPERKEITDIDVQNAILIFGILAREQGTTFEAEYAKGLLLLRMNHYEVNFNREAFMCFWRAFEHFAATRILGASKLKNELRDLQRSLKMVGMPEDLVQELREVYVIRSSQAAHAQNSVRDVTFDEVIKAKIFLDFVMHKTFKAQGVAILDARRNENKNAI